MKKQIPTEGSSNPQLKTACSPSEGSPEAVAVSDATSVTRRYRLACDGDYYTIKINKLTPDELRVAKPLVEDEAYDLYSLSDALHEHGFNLDIGNPNEDGFYDEADANDVTYTLYDADEREIFSGDIPRTAKDPELDLEIPPSRDGSRLVNFMRCHGPVRVYALETDELPRVEDFSTKAYGVRIDDITYTFLLMVYYKGKPLEFLEIESEKLVEDRDIRESYAILV